MQASSPNASENPDLKGIEGDSLSPKKGSFGDVFRGIIPIFKVVFIYTKPMKGHFYTLLLLDSGHQFWNSDHIDCTSCTK